MAKLLETVYQDVSASESDGVLRGVKLLGINSRNGRRYEAAALEKAKGLYEGRKVYVDHPRKEATGDDRSFGDWAGVIENVSYRNGDGLYGDVVLRRESDHFKGIIEAATHPKFHKSCGFSHVAEGESHFDGDTEIVESIREVFSVDLVTDPATTAGMFESAGKKRRKKPQTIKQTIESLPEATIRTKLVEMLGDYDMDMGGEAKGPHAQLGAIITQLVAALTETLKTLAAVKEKEPVPTPIPPAADEPEEDEMEDQPKLNQPAFESLQRELAEVKAKTLLLESGREATPARIKALAAATEEDKQELLESWAPAESERPPRSPAKESITVESLDFTQPGSFAARYR